MTESTIAVVVTYHREPPDQLRQCFESLRDQTLRPVVIAVRDGWAPNAGEDELVASELSHWLGRELVHLVLPEAHADFGNAARVVGSVEAMSRGADFVAWLDADNWLAPDHLAQLLAKYVETGAPIVTASRTLVRVDGSELYRDSECDGVKHVDTSCFFLSRQAFGLAPLWAYIPRELSAVSDRIFWRVVRAAGVVTAHNWAPTVFYRTRYAAHYQALGEAPPKDARGLERLPASRFTIGPPFNINMEVR